jgi:hypothetical protein
MTFKLYRFSDTNSTDYRTLLSTQGTLFSTQVSENSKHHINLIENHKDRRDICLCNKAMQITKKRGISKKRKPKKESKGLKLKYSNSNQLYSEIFQISYKKNLSSKAKCILNSFDKKYIYYAIDDILYLLKSTPNERNNLLKLMYSPIISLQNNFSVSFFDIWIQEISIDERIKKNRFLKTKPKTLKNDHLITIKLVYKIKKLKPKDQPIL